MSYNDRLEQFVKLRRDKAQNALKRIEQLVDAGSFVEFNAFQGVERTGSGVVTGYAVIAGRSVFVYAHETESLHGAFDEQQAEKICGLLNRALQTGTPVVGILSSDGAQLGDGLHAAAGYGRIITAAAKASGVIPHILVIDGPAVGAMALYAQCADIVVANDGSSYSVATASGAQLSAQEAAMAGVAAYAAANAQQADAFVRSALQYLPDNNLTASEYVDTADDINRLCPELNALADTAYDVKDVIKAVVDAGMFLELYSEYAPEMVTAFASIGGQSVGIAANQHKVNGGKITASAAKKAARFVNLCDSLGIPLILLCDSEGFASEKEAELGGMAGAAARLPFMLAQAKVPVITVVLSEAIGSAYIAMGSKSIGADVAYAWADAAIGLLKPAQAVALLKGEALKASADPIAQRAELAKSYAEESMNALEAAKLGYIDEPIEPAYTRMYLAAALEALYNKREQQSFKKNAVLPL